MKTVHSSRWLQWALAADALLGLLIAVAHLGGGHALAQVLALPPALLSGTGLFLLAWGALLAWLARQPQPVAGWIVAVVDANLLWGLASLGLLLTDTLAANAWGNAYLVINAVSTLAFATLQWLGLRRSHPAGMALA